MASSRTGIFDNANGVAANRFGAYTDPADAHEVCGLPDVRASCPPILAYQMDRVRLIAYVKVCTSNFIPMACLGRMGRRLGGVCVFEAMTWSRFLISLRYNANNVEIFFMALCM